MSSTRRSRAIGLSRALNKTPAATRPVDEARAVEERSLAFFETVAHRDVENYLKAPLVDVPLFNSSVAPYDPIEAWKCGDCVPSGAQIKPYADGAGKNYSFIAASAVAYLAGHATAARPERLFRDAKFVNGVLQQRQKPKTISRRTMFRKNSAYRIDVSSVVDQYYDKHPSMSHAKKRKRARDQGDDDSIPATPSAAA